MTVVKGHSKVRNVNNVSNGVSQLKLDICEMDLMMNYNELIRQNGMAIATTSHRFTMSGVMLVVVLAAFILLSAPI